MQDPLRWLRRCDCNSVTFLKVILVRKLLSDTAGDASSRCSQGELLQVEAHVISLFSISRNWCSRGPKVERVH